jgi:U3 small nucleolar RNA-associated protein 11
MSSFKKAIPKRKYKERGQPENRKHLGMLEKKRDYKIRAEDSHRKEAEINRLKDLAYNKNPDEFYFSMEKTRLVGGKHKKEVEEIAPELQKKQKVIEGNLLSMKAKNKAKKHEELQNSLHLIDAPAVNKHIVFVKTEEDMKKFDPSEHFGTVPELIDRKSNRLTKDQLKSLKIAEYSEPEGYQLLETLIKEERKLNKSLDNHLLQQKLMTKDKYKLIDEEKKIYKWFRERKR